MRLYMCDADDIHEGIKRHKLGGPIDSNLAKQAYKLPEREDLRKLALQLRGKRRG